MAEVIWTEPALSQLEAIADYIALDKPDAAAALVQHVMEATDNVESFLMLGRKVPELPHPNYRQLWVTPCWIYYRVEGDCAYVLHVRRAERLLRPGDLLAESD